MLLLTTMHVLHPEPLLRWFGTYWPAFIILWGVIKLVEYQQAQKEGVRPSRNRSRRRSAAGISDRVRHVRHFSFALESGCAPRPHQSWAMMTFQLFGHTYTYDDQVQQDFPRRRQPAHRE